LLVTPPGSVTVSVVTENTLPLNETFEASTTALLPFGAGFDDAAIVTAACFLDAGDFFETAMA
jgi:hypothetical protein